MGIPLFFQVLFYQSVAIAIVVAVLKKLLDKQLIELAVRRLEVLGDDEKPAELSRLKIVSHKPLPEVYRQRIQQAAKQHFGAALQPAFVIDKGIWGGLIIVIDKKMIECSVRSRLRQAFRQG